MVFAKLNQHQRELAYRTVSAWSFFYIVGDYLLNNRPLSIVRMGDGERSIIDLCIKASANGTTVNSPIDIYDQAKRQNMGLDGLTYKDLYRRLLRAGNDCTYFAPSVSGLTQEAYSLHHYFHQRESYIDNFFVNIWDYEAKATLYKAAGSILFIHKNPNTAASITRQCKDRFNIDVEFIQMDKWQQAEATIEQARSSSARLVLFAAGPASKYIASDIVQGTNKIALDLGNSVDAWTFGNN